MCVFRPDPNRIPGFVDSLAPASGLLGTEQGGGNQNPQEKSHQQQERKHENARHADLPEEKMEGYDPGVLKHHDQRQDNQYDDKNSFSFHETSPLIFPKQNYFITILRQIDAMRSFAARLSSK